MRRLQQLLAVFATLCLSSRCLAGIDDLVVGEYESDSVQDKLFWNATKNPDFYATVSGHAGISMLKAGATGWDQNLTLKQIGERIEKDSGRKLAVILLEVNYIGSENTDVSHTALVKLLLGSGFDRVIVTQAHSQLTIIEEIHKKSDQAGADQPATKPADKPPADVKQPAPTSKDAPSHQGRIKIESEQVVDGKPPQAPQPPR